MGGQGSNIVCRQHSPVGRPQLDVYLGRGHIDLPILCPSRAKEEGTETAGQDRVYDRGACTVIVWPEFSTHQEMAHKYH